MPREMENTMLSKSLRLLVVAGLALGVAAMAAGCKGKKDTPINPSMGGDPTGGAGAGGGAGDGLPNLSASELEQMLFGPSGLQTVYFDYDSSSLRSDAVQVLSANADKIKQAPGVFIQIEGHCDERGTQDYNFALGEKRALSVRDHLMKLGVDGSRLITISYGEEDPAVPGHNEAAWSQNRRAEFNKAM